MNILIAEDDTEIRHLVREILEEEGHACVEAGNGEEAKEAFQRVEQFDLLFSDLNMPKLGGRALLDWCKEQGINLPVIFTSANTEMLKEEKSKVEETHAAILPKPMDIADILNAVNSARDLAAKPPVISAQDFHAMEKNLH